jgi:hypothetical protein
MSPRSRMIALGVVGALALSSYPASGEAPQGPIVAKPPPRIVFGTGSAAMTAKVTSGLREVELPKTFPPKLVLDLAARDGQIATLNEYLRFPRAQLAVTCDLLRDCVELDAGAIATAGPQVTLRYAVYFACDPHDQACHSRSRPVTWSTPAADLSNGATVTFTFDPKKTDISVVEAAWILYYGNLTISCHDDAPCIRKTVRGTGTRASLVEDTQQKELSVTGSYHADNGSAAQKLYEGAVNAANALTGNVLRAPSAMRALPPRR